MSAKCSWGHAGDEGPGRTEGGQPSADPGRSAQRRFRSSAFPSSLSWDSDSEKETLDGNTWLDTLIGNLLQSSGYSLQHR